MNARDPSSGAVSTRTARPAIATRLEGPSQPTTVLGAPNRARHALRCTARGSRTWRSNRQRQRPCSNTRTRTRTTRGWQRTIFTVWVWAAILTVTARPCTRTVTHTAGTLTRSVARRHCSASTIRVPKEIALAVGWRMLSVHVAGADQPALPEPSRALFALEQVTVCTPRPCTGIVARAPGRHCAVPPSTEHDVPATPDGPATAVAATSCVPAVVEASCGPDSAIDGSVLSTSIVLEAEPATPAASIAARVSATGP